MVDMQFLIYQKTFREPNKLDPSKITEQLLEASTVNYFERTPEGEFLVPKFGVRSKFGSRLTAKFQIPKELQWQSRQSGRFLCFIYSEHGFDSVLGLILFKLKE